MTVHPLEWEMQWREMWTRMRAAVANLRPSWTFSMKMNQNEIRSFQDGDRKPAVTVPTFWLYTLLKFRFHFGQNRACFETLKSKCHYYIVFSIVAPVRNSSSRSFFCVLDVVFEDKYKNIIGWIGIGYSYQVFFFFLNRSKPNWIRSALGYNNMSFENQLRTYVVSFSHLFYRF